MIASDIMSSPVYVVGLQENVAHARHLMLAHKNLAPACPRRGQARGHHHQEGPRLPAQAIGPHLEAAPESSGIPVHVLMVPDPVSVATGTGVRDIAALMVARDFSGLPVLDEKSSSAWSQRRIFSARPR